MQGIVSLMGGPVSVSYQPNPGSVSLLETEDFSLGGCSEFELSAGLNYWLLLQSDSRFRYQRFSPVVHDCFAAHVV